MDISRADEWMNWKKFNAATVISYEEAAVGGYGDATGIGELMKPRA